MKIRGFSTDMWVWGERYSREGHHTSLKELLRDCAEAGLDAIEIEPDKENRVWAKNNGLTISGAYLNLTLHTTDFDIEKIAMPFARKLAEAGGSDFVVNADSKADDENDGLKTEDEIRRQGEHLSRIAAAAGKLGLKTSMHNHAAEHTHAGNDLRSVVEYASPEVGLCIDTGWAFTAGYDPVEWIRQYPDRVFAFHLRNQMGQLPSEDLVEGQIDMRKLMGELADLEYQGWLTLELWHPAEIRPQRTMVDDVRISVEYLRKLIREQQQSFTSKHLIQGY